MTQRQITNYESANLLVLIGSTRVLPEIILNFRHLKYRSEKIYIEANQFYDILIVFKFSHIL
jgi:hypothetical protein